MDPVGYCRDILDVRLTPDQERIARKLCEPPYKVLVRAGHNVGKSFLAACMISWWYDCFDPGIVLSTAPTERQVQKILWKELRLLRARHGGFSGPSVCQMQSAPDHYAMGFTSRDGDRFQGHHSPAVMIVFDEAVGIDPIFWEASETMLGGERFAFLGIYNPTDTSSYAWQAEQTGNFHIETLSALTHPNIAAEANGKKPPYPSAVRLERLQDMMEQWAIPIPYHSASLAEREEGGKGGVGIEEDNTNGSIVFFNNQYWKLGPIAESRVAGLWPSQAINAVFSEKIVRILLGIKSDGTYNNLPRRVLDSWPVQIGCDPARFGDDDTCFHVRAGTVSLHHESRNGWSTRDTAKRCRELAWQYGQKFKGGPQKVPVLIDETGIGAGVIDNPEGYNFIPINAGRKAMKPEFYHNTRAELWMSTAELAKQGVVLDVSRLDPGVVLELKRQLLAPTYTLNGRGVIVLEDKEDTKKRLGRSPDDADAFNLAYLYNWPGREQVLGAIQ